MSMSFLEELARCRAAHDRAMDLLVEGEAESLDRIARRIADALAGGGKLLVFGNGGSAALAQEIAAELVNRYRQTRRAFGAIALGVDGAVVSSIGNDTSFDQVFARQIEGLGRPGDIALALSTSGRSANIVAGLQAARRQELTTVALLGRDGGQALEHCDTAVVIEAEETARIQEAHLFAAHFVCSRVESALADHEGWSDERSRPAATTTAS